MHETVDVDNLLIKLKYLIIQKQQAVTSGALSIMVVLSKTENDSSNQRIFNSFEKLIGDLQSDPVPVGVVALRDTDLLALDLYGSSAQEMNQVSDPFSIDESLPKQSFVFNIAVVRKDNQTDDQAPFGSSVLLNQQFLPTYLHTVLGSGASAESEEMKQFRLQSLIQTQVLGGKLPSGKDSALVRLVDFLRQVQLLLGAKINLSILEVKQAATTAHLFKTTEPAFSLPDLSQDAQLCFS